MPTFWRVFIINRCWILSKAFSASTEMIIWFLFFNLLISCITLIDLHILKNPCIPGINPTWSWYIIIVHVVGFSLLIPYGRCFTSKFMRDIGLKFYFTVFIVFVWFWYQGDAGLIEWIWKWSFLCNFLEWLEDK